MTTQNTTYHPNQFTPPQAQAFSAKERDSATGLDYFGARYYSSGLSVWLSVDALADKYPSTSSFMYVRGNPVMLVDKWGLKPEKYDPPKGMNPELYDNTEEIDEYRGNGDFRYTENRETNSIDNNNYSGQAASAQTKTKPVKKFKKLPPFSVLESNYPKYGIDYPNGGISDSQFANMVGGKVILKIEKGIFANTCSLRVSYSLNMSGEKIPYILDQTSSGSNGYWYIFRVKELVKYMKIIYGPPSVKSSNPADFQGKKGIIIFDMSGTWNDAYGHSTLWDGKTRLGGNYLVNFYFNNANIVMLWETN